MKMNDCCKGYMLIVGHDEAGDYVTCGNPRCITGAMGEAEDTLQAIADFNKKAPLRKKLLSAVEANKKYLGAFDFIDLVGAGQATTEEQLNAQLALLSKRVEHNKINPGE